MYLRTENMPRVEVQPDAIITTPSVYCLVEAKRIRSSSFQPRQLAREFVMAQQFAGERRPILALLLSAPPPVRVQGRGRLSIRDAIVSNQPSPITYNAPKPREILDEDRVIQNYRIAVKATAVKLAPIERIFQ